MAQIVLSIQEVSTLISGMLQNETRILAVTAENSAIKFNIQTPGILPSVSIAITFAEFKEGKAHFHLKANPLVQRIIERFKHPALRHLKIEPSKLIVDVDAMLKEKAPMVRIKDVQQPSPDKILVTLYFV